MRALPIAAALGLVFIAQAQPTARKTVASIDGREFQVNRRPTYAGRSYDGMSVQGLLEIYSATRGVR